jgi:Xaa-Pro aminopeptidase
MNQEILKNMKKHQCDALFLKNDSNIRYVSNFTGSDSYVLILNNVNYFITDPRSNEQAEEECPDFQVETIGRDFSFLIQLLVKLVDKHNIKSLAFEENHVSFSLYQALKTALPHVQLIPNDNIVEKVRYSKNQTEIEHIKKAVQITDMTFKQFLPFLKIGMTELEAVLKLEFMLRENGSQGIAFSPILLSGNRTSMPHGKPSEKKIEKGDFVIMDFGAKYNGYCSDMTRTVVMGQASEKQLKVYEIVQESQRVGLENVRAGVKGKEVRKKVTAVMNKYEFRDYASKGLGHGIGLDNHEKPIMNDLCEDILLENTLVTVEPGIYIPKWGGVRIEDTVIVTDGPCQVLMESPKELISL